jgi:hypothetical protein
MVLWAIGPLPQTKLPAVTGYRNRPSPVYSRHSYSGDSVAHGMARPCRNQRLERHPDLPSGGVCLLGGTR